jgi:hypothetical protein
MFLPQLGLKRGRATLRYYDASVMLLFFVTASRKPRARNECFKLQGLRRENLQPLCPALILRWNRAPTSPPSGLR